MAGALALYCMSPGRVELRVKGCFKHRKLKVFTNELVVATAVLSGTNNNVTSLAVANSHAACMEVQ